MCLHFQSRSGTAEQGGWGGYSPPPLFCQSVKNEKGDDHQSTVKRSIKIFPLSVGNSVKILTLSESMGDDYDDGNTTLNIMIDVNRKRYVTWHNKVTVNSVKGNQDNNCIQRLAVYHHSMQRALQSGRRKTRGVLDFV